MFDDMTLPPHQIAILGLWDGVNTARYFEASAKQRGLILDRIDTPLLKGARIDLELVVDPQFANPRRLRDVPCTTAGVLIDVHQQLDLRLAYARFFDHVFIAQRDYLPKFEALPHPSVHWLPLACEPSVHFVPAQERTIDVGFVGKLGHSGSERLKVLRQVLSVFRTNDYTRPHSPSEMGAIYSRSKIVFNKSVNRDVNMRFFEALASGALLVTDRTGNGLEDLATEGVHYVGYDTAAEAIETIAHYLARDAERQAIAAAGQRLAFERHTYAARLQSIFDTIGARSTARAPARTAGSSEEIAWRSECLRLQGASLCAAASLLMEGHWTAKSLSNTATGVARGVVRPLRKKFTKR